MKTALTLIMILFTSVVCGQYFEIELLADSALKNVEIYYIFEDTSTKKPDSLLYETRAYTNGLLKSTESFGQPGYSFITDYYFYPNSTNLHRTVKRTLYNRQDSAISIDVHEYDSYNQKYFTLHHDSSAQGEFSWYEFFHNIYNENGQIALQYSIQTIGLGYMPKIISYQYDKQGHIMRDTASAFAPQLKYNDKGQIFQKTVFFPISDQVARNPGQTFQKDIHEYYYNPNGQFSLKKHYHTIDNFGKNITYEFRAYYNYKK